MDSCVIKEIQETEIDTCVEVIRQSFSTVANDFGLTKENCPTNGAFIQKERIIAEKAKGNLMYALYINKKMAGFIALENKKNGTFELEKLAVLPNFRHLGYGKSLLDFVKNEVINLSGNIITIGIIEGNTKLKRWYEQNGFVHKGTKVFPHLPFTVGFMELVIYTTV